MNVKVKDKVFLQYVRNTLNDFRTQDSNEKEIIESLKNILSTKTLTLLNVQYLFRVIKTREENLDYIKDNQDYESFMIVNREHRHMKQYILKFFTVEGSSDFLTISLKVKGQK